MVAEATLVDQVAYRFLSKAQPRIGLQEPRLGAPNRRLAALRLPAFSRTGILEFPIVGSSRILVAMSLHDLL
jgi:hypothetical protein